MNYLLFQHPEFSPSDPCGGNDIALLRLETAMDITEHVQTLQLPSAEQEFTGNGDCWIVGFGQSGEILWTIIPRLSIGNIILTGDPDRFHLLLGMTFLWIVNG